MRHQRPMLARPENFRCVECGRAFGAPGFAYYHGEIARGAAYWSDQGVLCSPACSTKHIVKRKADGTLPDAPMPNPMTGEF